MKKLLTDSNLWFFTTAMSSLAWAFSDNGEFWMIFAFASFILGVESKKKEKGSNKNQ